MKTFFFQSFYINFMRILVAVLIIKKLFICTLFMNISWQQKKFFSASWDVFASWFFKFSTLFWENLHFFLFCTRNIIDMAVEWRGNLNMRWFQGWVDLWEHFKRNFHGKLDLIWGLTRKYVKSIEAVYYLNSVSPFSRSIKKRFSVCNDQRSIIIWRRVFWTSSLTPHLKKNLLKS